MKQAGAFPRTLLPAAFVTGACAALAFEPFAFYPIAFISLGLLYAGLRKATSRAQAALLGFLWGLGCFTAGVSWVYVSMHDVGGMPALMAAAATLALASLLALYPAVAAAVFVSLRHHRTRDCLIFAAAWTLAEWLRGTLLTGFPWLAIGYSQIDSPLGSYAPLLGVYGVGFVTALAAALLATFLARPRRGRWVLSATTLLILLGLALQPIHWTEPVGEPIKVSLLQGNIPQSLKWDPDRLPLSMQTYAALAQQQPADLMVLPETAIPLMFGEIPKSYLLALNPQRPVLLGAAMALDGHHYANAALLLQGEQSPAAYLKQHLVPFGEFVPPGFAWFFDFVRIPMSGFTAGDRHQPAMTLGNEGDTKIAPNICYEDLFGEEIIAALPAANILINLSNTAWFGDSLAQPQHLQIAQMRARETGRMMLRATNTGMTAAITPDGRIADALAPFTRAALVVEAQGYAGSTPYVRTGNAPILILVLSLLIAAYSRRTH